MVNAFEAASTNRQQNYKTQAKMEGFVKKMMGVNKITSLSVYTQILDHVGILAFIFSRKGF